MGYPKRVGMKQSNPSLSALIPVSPFEVAINAHSQGTKLKHFLVMFSFFTLKFFGAFIHPLLDVNFVIVLK
jgi:hypothetical protein